MTDRAPSRLRSYMFWKKMFEKHPDVFKGYKFPDEPYSEWVKKGGEICPFCDGYQMQDSTDPAIYCMCSTLRWLESRHRDLHGVETPVQPARMSDLAPLKGQPGADTLGKLTLSLKQWIKDPRDWYFISGGTGVGKTHMLRSIKTFFGPLAFYISSESFQGSLFSGLNLDRGAGVQKLIDLLATVPILLFDDLGIEHKGSFFIDSLAAVVNRRYNAGPQDFPIVMTSNLAVGELASSPDLPLKRIASRMFDEQYSKVWRLDQPDYRLPSTKKA